jgi:hypothetical protein
VVGVSVCKAILFAVLIMMPVIAVLYYIKKSADSLSDDMHRQYYEDRKDIPYFRELWGLDEKE